MSSLHGCGRIRGMLVMGSRGMGSFWGCLGCGLRGSSVGRQRYTHGHSHTQRLVALTHNAAHLKGPHRAPSPALPRHPLHTQRPHLRRRRHAANPQPSHLASHRSGHPGHKLPRAEVDARDVVRGCAGHAAGGQQAARRDGGQGVLHGRVALDAGAGAGGGWRGVDCGGAGGVEAEERWVDA